MEQVYTHCDLDSESARSVLAPGKAWESPVPVERVGKSRAWVVWSADCTYFSMVLAPALYLRDQEVESDFWRVHGRRKSQYSLIRVRLQ